MAHYSYRRIVHALDDNWQFYDSGDQSIQWVEGELPWVAQRDDSYNYVELIKPPYMLNCEYTEQEV